MQIEKVNNGILITDVDGCRFVFKYFYECYDFLKSKLDSGEPEVAPNKNTPSPDDIPF